MSLSLTVGRKYVISLVLGVFCILIGLLVTQNVQVSLLVASIPGILVLFRFRLFAIFVIFICLESTFYPDFFGQYAGFYVSDILLLMFLGIWFSTNLRNGFRDIRTRIISKELLIFFAITIFSCLNAKLRFEAPIDNILGNFRFSMYLLSGYLIIVHYIKKLSDLETFLKFLIIISTICMLIGFYTSLRPDSFLCNFLYPAVSREFGYHTILSYTLPASYLTFFVFIICIGLSLYINQKWIMYAWILFPALLLTQSRSMMISIAISFIVLIVIESLTHHRTRIIMVHYLMSFAIILSITAFSFSTNLFSRYITLLHPEDVYFSQKKRVLEIEASIGKIKKNPIFGIGIGTPYVEKYTRSSLYSKEETYYIHNGYLGILYKLGIVGFVSFILINYRFYLAAKRIFISRNSSSFSKGLLIGIVAFYLSIIIVQELVTTWILVYQKAFIVGVAFGLVSFIHDRNERHLKKRLLRRYAY